MVSTVPGLRRGKKIVLSLDPSPHDRSQVGLLNFLCDSYDACMSEKPRMLVSRATVSGEGVEPLPPADFVEFLGNRDFMGFLKKLGNLARGSPSQQISCDKIIEALERNMNGVEPHKLQEIIHYFMMPFSQDASLSSGPAAVRV